MKLPSTTSIPHWVLSSQQEAQDAQEACSIPHWDVEDGWPWSWLSLWSLARTSQAVLRPIFFALYMLRPLYVGWTLLLFLHACVSLMALVCTMTISCVPSPDGKSLNLVSLSKKTSSIRFADFYLQFLLLIINYSLHPIKKVILVFQEVNYFNFDQIYITKYLPLCLWYIINIIG
jgi:hypothetical protein